MDLNYAKLSHSDPLVRKSAAQAIWRNCSVKDLQRIQNALVLEQDPRVVKWLAYTLAKIGDSSSLVFLGLKLKDVENEDARDWILMSKGLLSETVTGLLDFDTVEKLLDSSSLNDQREGALLTWHTKDLPETIRKKLTDKVNHVDPGVRRWAILSLGNSSKLPSSDIIIGGLDDSDYLVREWTENVLARIKDPTAFVQLASRMHDRHPRVREWAIKAIAAYGLPDTPGILMHHFVGEQDELCREGIVTALRPWSEQEEVCNFLLFILRTEQSTVVKSSVIETIHLSSKLRVDPIVIEALLDIESKFVDNALRAQVGSTLLHTCTDDEIKQIGVLLGSKRLRLLVDFLRVYDFEDSAPMSKAILENPVKLFSLEGKPLLSSVGTSSHSSGDVAILGRAVDDAQRLVDVGVVVALKEEFRELLGSLEAQILPTSDKDPETGEIFYKIDFSETAGMPGYTCVFTLIGGMGPAKAAIKADRLITRYRPRTAVIIGIAAGVHKDVKVGDVVIARQVDGYIESSKAIKTTGDDFGFLLSGNVFQSSETLVRDIANYEFSFIEGFEQWLKDCSARLNELVPQDIRDELVNTGVIREKPVIHEGSIASGPVVGATSAFTQWLLTRDRNYKALEMESVGLMEATSSLKNPPLTLVIRGISDYGDDRKSHLDAIKEGGLRKLAMQNASRLFWSILRQGILPRA